MTVGLTDISLSQLSDLLAVRMGLYFPKERWPYLVRGMSAAAADFGFKNVQTFVQWLLTSPLTKNHLGILANHFTIGETYFFREKRSFEILQEHIFPALLHSRRGTAPCLRIWSAGCSTGEEPYSVAILLNTMLHYFKDWHITILATDINTSYLQKALAGVYGEWSFRDVPPGIKERYFKPTKEGRFEILPHLKQRVHFTYLNLVEDAYPSFLNNTGSMDIIFCRNVLMYFTPERRQAVIKRFFHSLADGGWLVVGPSETARDHYAQFVEVNFPGAVFYKKERKNRNPGDFEEKNLFYIPQNADLERELRDKASLPGRTDPVKETIVPPINEVLVKDNNQKTFPNAYEAALALYGQGYYAAALEKILEGGKHSLEAQAMALLARIYANQGELAEAQKWCAQAIVADKLNPGFHYLLATILQEQGQVEAAILSLKRALYLDQHLVLAHFALGNLTRQQGLLQESKKHFENAMKLLRDYDQKTVLPESEGLTAGRILAIIASMTVNSPQK